LKPQLPLARNSDPDTSHAAAASMIASQQSIHQRILKALTRPMTQFEVAHVTGLRPEQVHKRLSELARDNIDTGFTAAIGDSGMRRIGDTVRMCIVWQRIR
jgi:DNA-binding Lrp family transcriptional regulator